LNTDLHNSLKKNKLGCESTIKQGGIGESKGKPNERRDMRVRTPFSEIRCCRNAGFESPHAFFQHMLFSQRIHVESSSPPHNYLMHALLNEEVRACPSYRNFLGAIDGSQLHRFSSRWTWGNADLRLILIFDCSYCTVLPIAASPHRSSRIGVLSPGFRKVASDNVVFRQLNRWHPHRIVEFLRRSAKSGGPISQTPPKAAPPTWLFWQEPGRDTRHANGRPPSVEDSVCGGRKERRGAEEEA
jgi:hypothetical protein